MRACWVLLCAALLATPARAEPDAALLGEAQGYPLGTVATLQQQRFRVGSWSALDQVPDVRVRRVAPSAIPLALPVIAEPPALRYRFRGVDYTLADYLERQRATGLLILKDGRIVAEHYRYGRQPGARFLSFSMAKSVTSLLVGIAQARGLLDLDQPAATYVEALRGTPYGDTPSGTVSRYASGETEVLGRVLAAATGGTLADLTRDWLWQPMGAEHEAFWRIGADGQEGASGHFNASLRDWARLGLLLANDGRVGDRQVVPREYLLAATDARRQPAGFRPGEASAATGYGYLFWLLPYQERSFGMQGVHGQAVYVQPASGIVMVLTSVWQHPSSQQDPQPAQERAALWRGVLQSLGGMTQPWKSERLAPP